jgi:hypothetical protein
MKSNDAAGTASIPSSRSFPWLSAMLFIFALAAMVTLLASDALNALSPTTMHRRAGAFSLMLMGSSFVALQLSSRRPSAEKLKPISLGIAFFLWGGGQFLPPGRLATATDTAVMVIFVIDLSLAIIEHLKRNQYE